MLEGRIEMNEVEEARVDALVEEFGRGALSRRDPGEKGPVLFKHKDGRVWEIDGEIVRQVREARNG